MYFASVFFLGFLMTLCISNIQAKPFLFSAYEDEDFGNDFVDYFIDVDTSRTPTLRVNPFSLPANKEPVVSRAEVDDDSSFEIFESPVVYADTFELAFDEAADRLENILRLAVKKFKESFIHSFETLYNSSVIEETANNSSNKDGEKVITNITSSIVDVNKEKENENKIEEIQIEENKIEENKIEENKKNATQSEKKKNLVEDNTIKATVQAVDLNEATTDIKSTTEDRTTVENVVIPENEVKLENEIKLENEVKLENDIKPENKLMLDNGMKPEVQKTKS